MKNMILLCIGLWLCVPFINGIMSIETVFALLSTALFCSRIIGHFSELKNILLVEGLGLFLHVMLQFTFHKFSLIKLILTLITRIVFLCVVIYDKENYVYETREEKRV